MNGRLETTVRAFGYALIAVILVFAATYAYASATPNRVFAAGLGILLLLSWVGEPLLRKRRLRAQAALPRPSQDVAPDQPRTVVPYALTEAEWVRAKLLYRGVHTATGFARQIALDLLAIMLGAILISALFYFFLGAALALEIAILPIGFGALMLVLDYYYRGPLEAAQTFRANASLWWPAKLAWNAEGIFIENSEERFRYPLSMCSGWKEDASLILLRSKDNRFWCFPKRALEAARTPARVQAAPRRPRAEDEGRDPDPLTRLAVRV